MPIDYSSEERQLLLQKRCVGPFDIRVDLSVVPGVPMLHNVELIEEKVAQPKTSSCSNLGADKYSKKTVIKLDIVKRSRSS